MQVVIKRLVLGLVLTMSITAIHADSTNTSWAIKTPHWELSKHDLATILKVKGADAKTLSNPTQREQILQDIYIRESLVHQALQQKLEQESEVQQQLEELRRDLLARVALEKALMQNQPDFTQRAKELYQSQLATRFSFPIRYKLQIIQLNRFEADQQTLAQQQLAKIRTNIQAGTISFDQALEQYSEAPDKALTRAGEWYKLDQLPTGVAKAASGLSATQPLSEVVVTEKAIYLLKWLEQREPETIPFEQVKDEIEQSLILDYKLTEQKAKLAELRQQFKQDAQVHWEP